jgi:hypothetical protein
MVRMFAILAGFGLVIALLSGRFETAAVQVTFFGSGLPTPDPANFDPQRCGPSAAAGTAKPDTGCYAYLRPDSNEPLECDYNLGFRAGSAAVKRLRVKVAIVKQGKELGRHRVAIDNLVRPADSPYVSASIRGECDADHLQIVEARAYVDGQETDLIAAGAIRSRGLMPLMPDLFVTIGAAAGA